MLPVCNHSAVQCVQQDASPLVAPTAHSITTSSQQHTLCEGLTWFCALVLLASQTFSLDNCQTSVTSLLPGQSATLATLSSV